jgi:hypothetical protein
MKLDHLIIDSVEKWKQFAPPFGGDKQWEDGRSAKELAKYIIGANGILPKEIEAVIPKDLYEGKSFVWTPEYVTYFDKTIYGPGNGRNHDMVMYNDKAFIGIEAKADETFDKTLEDWLKSGESENSKANRKKRLNAMCNLILGRGYLQKTDSGLRYQLFSAITGIIIEAEKRSLENAMLVIITFKVKGHFSERKTIRNENDLSNFLGMKELEYCEKDGKIKSYSGIKNLYVRHITIEK